MDCTEVYQFKISLKGLEPAIWRRIQVPVHYSFWDLHVAIQDSMGWLDYHLHVFRIVNPELGEREEIGIPDDEDGLFEILPGWELAISEYSSSENNCAEYEYDFGDSWEHEIILEKILPRDTDSEYPKCIAGERACPPEDCGGIDGYQELLEAIYIPSHEEHKSTKTRAGASFDSEKFDPTKVQFDDPEKRWEKAFSGEL
ncbi:plasmid pRiA4b ORF-3 family protein [Acidobacteria bacterium AH-259-O06]|nr:plasmid pRiA4b ORF-3 family protein [Acidobacteria bacterium AH-259-O06]